MEVDDTCEGFFDLGGLWDTTIDDITLSQASEQIEKEIECENLLENIALSQSRTCRHGIELLCGF